MKKAFLLFILLLAFLRTAAQCNDGLNLGTVIVPTHGNVTNSGNFGSAAGWQQAAQWVDSLKLDYRQPYLTWTDVVTQISSHVPVYNTATIAFQNQLNSWAGNPYVHIIYSTTKVGVPNTLESIPSGFGPFVSFTDTAYVNQNYQAIKYMLSQIHNVKWISIGNEIETYFGGTYENTGRLNQYGAFLATLKGRINSDFPGVRVGTVFAFHNLTWAGKLNMIDSVLSAIDYVGYTFYYSNQTGDCWDAPATVQGWLNSAYAKTGSRKLMITETCMGDGGGTGQNCGSPSKQLAYADSLLSWYNTNRSKIEGITWFTITDPYLGWQTPSTLWNTSGLTDSSGLIIQPAGTVWQHHCPTTRIQSQFTEKISIYPNPFGNSIAIKIPQNRNGDTALSVFTNLGVEVMRIIISEHDAVFNTTFWPAGMYYFKFENNARIQIQKASLVK